MLETVKVSTKYQVVIPKAIRNIVGKIKPGQELYVEAVDKNTVQLSIKDKGSWIARNAGIAKGAWGEDSTQYLNDLRGEWRERQKQLWEK